MALVSLLASASGSLVSSQIKRDSTVYHHASNHRPVAPLRHGAGQVTAVFFFIWFDNTLDAGSMKALQNQVE